ncbi:MULTISPECIES: hypothetical protein [unclassified Ensifer]|uniref:hypothetical protein n=1 Tax=unclassified Ensifer TaxID=2633371 RepID=UPI000813AA0A|nr:MULTISPECIES: hypothetical protein [unclassified Ensifer]OCP08403.1 hypothetical protein BBX50_20100 [Ensifer sp. LC11]OCP09022.1 hypothetical protein BC374_19890 [Ensifer sp. LC13]OCP09805.1 hypothetical protein BC362_08665 [Ensifer sp. LC14]OCP32288.1 hypothetical protein BC364_19290 [Ensifer sp. LC499]
MDDAWPTWLSIMEHGSVGEARTRSFLIDRFWVLERSVDIDGADFLIQLRNPTQRFTDNKPPRIGVIQAKYFQDRRTTHYIPKSYVLDDKGTPLEGFFSLLHVGMEDSGVMYLLSAKDIADNLTLSTARSPEAYVVGTKALVDAFRVNSRKLSLDRIAHSLRSQSYQQLAAISDQLNIPFRRVNKDDIDFNWTLPLPNPIGDITKMFVDQKEELRGLLFEMEEVIQIVDSILAEKDPRKALSRLDELNNHVDGRRKIPFGVRSDFRWDDFEEALSRHGYWLDALQHDGLLAAYVTMGELLRDELTAHTQANPPTQVNDFLEADLQYDPLSFKVKSMTISHGAAGGGSPEITSAGHVRVSRPYDQWTMRKSNAVEHVVHNVWWSAMGKVVGDRYPHPDDI